MRVRAMIALVSAVALAGCGETIDASAPIAGTYSASVFRVTPSGQSLIDVLGAGGSLAITIDGSNGVSGTLTIPASIAGTLLTQSMAGYAITTGTTLQFTQSADTFVRNLTWTISGTTLTVTAQVVSGTTYTITLTRQ